MDLPVLNRQKAEGHTSDPKGNLDVVKVFSTIQGEGPFAGTPAIFVRLAGCNVQCPVCDSDYTSDRKMYTPLELFQAVIDTNAWLPKIPLVVITGGEPFRQNFIPFLNTLSPSRVAAVQIETNGLLWQDSFPSTKYPPFVVCSPKGPNIHAALRPYISDLKYVIAADRISIADGLPTGHLGLKSAPARPWEGFKGITWVQPQDDQDETRNKRNYHATAFVAKRYGYRVSVQMHKILGEE